ncbi:phytase [Coprinopsis marcescibilis]|uniref:Phytase A n=1 Tax=Coprinopsis marcescibilis TaxID=230819 RepID=A0A5C3L8Y5_COPMA|nr:phytase [Coprinopsis marcescibilis]
MAFATLVFIFTLTLYTCIIYGPIAQFSTLPASWTASPVPWESPSSWGAYTPYFPAEIYRRPPKDCKINQVGIQRHGARFPTSGSDSRIRGALEKLQSANAYLDPRLSFLKDYRYQLGLDDLVPFGAFQSAESGAKMYERYRKLVSKGNVPFVRASGSVRVIDSATNWTAGFTEAANNIYRPKLALILPEHLNDTLEDAMCPSAGNPEEQTEVWTSIFATPIAQRLNAQAPGANLTPSDVAALIPLCAFESVALETLSRFCELFTPAEFTQFQYLSDIEKYYNRGYGQPLGPVQGVGYINELLARLTRKQVKDETQTNRTLDASPLTFPLDRSIYADFSHDNLMVAVFAAMGLFRQPTHLDPTMPSKDRTWFTNKLVPFSARMVVERMQCKVAHGIDEEVWEGSVGRFKGKLKRKGKTYVRILVNDAVQPLEFCGGDKHGLCALEAFVESQAYARNNGNGDFGRCYEKLQ